MTKSSLILLSSLLIACGGSTAQTKKIESNPPASITPEPAEEAPVYDEELNLEVRIPPSPWNTDIKYGLCDGANFRAVANCGGDSACVSQKLGETCASCVQDVITCGPGEECQPKRIECLGPDAGAQSANARTLPLILAGPKSPSGVRVSPPIEHVEGVSADGRSVVGFTNGELCTAGVNGEIEIDLESIFQTVASGEKCRRVFEAGGQLITFDCPHGGWTVDATTGLLVEPTPRARVRIEKKTVELSVISHRDGDFEPFEVPVAWPSLSPYDPEVVAAGTKVYRRDEVLVEFETGLANGLGTTPWLGPFYVLTVPAQAELGKNRHLVATSLLDGESHTLAEDVGTIAVIPGIGVFTVGGGRIKRLFPNGEFSQEAPLRQTFMGAKAQVIGTGYGSQFVGAPLAERLIHEVPLWRLYPLEGSRFVAISEMAVSIVDAEDGSHESVWTASDSRSRVQSSRVIDGEVVLLTAGGADLNEFTLFALTPKLEQRATVTLKKGDSPKFDANSITRKPLGDAFGGAIGFAGSPKEQPQSKLPRGCRDYGTWWPCVQGRKGQQTLVLRKSPDAEVVAEFPLPSDVGRPDSLEVSHNGKFVLYADSSGNRIVFDVSKGSVRESAKQRSRDRVVFAVLDDGSVFRVEAGILRSGLAD